MLEEPDADWFDTVTGAESPPELTTIAPEYAVVHEGLEVRRYTGLTPDTPYERDGFAFTTLPEPGAHLVTFATINDVHFGEVEAGIISGSDIGPTFRTPEGHVPYPEMMNRSAVAEMATIDPAVVIVKGDLTADGREDQYETFLSVYEPVFGDRLYATRGNHEAYNNARFAAEPFRSIDLPGVTLAIFDTAIDGETHGTVSAEQLAWLDDLAADADRTVLVFGHHHLGDPDSREKADQSFGLDLAASAEFLALVSRRPRIRGYFAGHTHRNRVRHFAPSGDVPWVEVASAKDYPGVWAEYRVHEQGILQIVHRTSSPEALVWTEKTRHMYAGTYHDYAFGSLTDRCFAISHVAGGGA